MSRVLIGTLLLCAGVFRLTADPLDTWFLRHSLLIEDDVRTVAFGGGRFVVAGSEGTILTSQDGIRWTAKKGEQTQRISGIAYGNGLFVAAGYAGKILTSTNGVDWSPQWSRVENGFSGVAYGNGRFVVVGGSTPGRGGRSERVILTSSDGVRWTVRLRLPDEATLLKVIFAQDQFVAVGTRGLILTSKDGDTWITTKTTMTDSIWGIAYGNGRFVATAPHARVLTSTNGLEWKTNSVEIKGQMMSVYKVAFGSGQFVATGNGAKVWTSPDGLSWTLRIWNFAAFPYDITFADGQFVAVGFPGAVVTSEDGIRWTVRHSNEVDWLSRVTFGNGQFVASGTAWHVEPGGYVANQGMFRLLSSADGINWPIRYSDTNVATYAYGVGFGLVFGAGKFVTFDQVSVSQAKVLSSTDATNWTARIVNADVLPAKMVYDQGKFVGVGRRIWTSSDGVEWQSYNSGSLHWPSVAYGHGQFVAIGGTAMFKSRDGTNWIAGSLPYGPADIAFGNGQFVGVGESAGAPQVVKSSDAILWRKQPTPVGLTSGNHSLASVAFGGGWFVGVGEGGIIVTSQDGSQWTVRESGTTQNLASVAYGNGSFVAVGRRGVILQSGNLLAATLSAPRQTPAGFAFAIEGASNQVYRIQATTNLASGNWVDVETITNAQAVAPFLDRESPRMPHRFCRALAVPW